MIMRTFKVTVNGVAYDVTVEEYNGTAPVVPAVPATPVVSAAPVAPAAPVATVSPTAPVAPAASAAPGSGEKVCAPMPGSIVKMCVKVGDTVNNGDLLCVLEAMKMENEIFAPVGGTVSSVVVNQGATVNSGDVLITIA